MKHIDHIGIAVKKLEDSIAVFEKLLNTACYKKELVVSEQVTTAFLKTGETKIELLQDEKEDGVINSFITKKGEGIHHIAFEVENIQEEIAKNINNKLRDNQVFLSTIKKVPSYKGFNEK